MPRENSMSEKEDRQEEWQTTEVRPEEEMQALGKKTKGSDGKQSQS